MSGLAAWQGRTVALVVIGFAVWLATHAALSAKWRAKIGDMLLPGRFRSRGKLAHRFTASVGAVLIGLGAAAIAAQETTGWWWIGIPVAWGCLAHSLGDALTFSAVPLWWPLQIRGCRWAKVGTPRWMRFRTGSRTETVVVAGFAVAGGVAIYALM